VRNRGTSPCTVRSTAAGVAAAAAVAPQMTLAAAGNPLVVLKGIVTGVKVSTCNCVSIVYIFC
jgi:hypothetical protein